jgi:hypothetical protein
LGREKKKRRQTMVYRFTGPDDQLLKFDTDTAELLLSTQWEAGQDRSRWIEIYRSSKGRYIQIGRTLWQGEYDTVDEIEECEALRRLALAEDRQCTEEGDKLLAERDPSVEI